MSHSGKRLIVKIDNHRFEDRRQADLYRELKSLERAGVITELKLNQRYHLKVPKLGGGIARIGTYDAVFSYKRDGKLVLIDGRDEREQHGTTSGLGMKRRLAQALLGAEIQNGY